MRAVVNDTALAAEAKSGRLIDKLDGLVANAGGAGRGGPGAGPGLGPADVSKLTAAYIANAEEVSALFGRHCVHARFVGTPLSVITPPPHVSRRTITTEWGCWWTLIGLRTVPRCSHSFFLIQAIATD